MQKGVINEAHNGYLELWLYVGLPITIVATSTIAAGMLFDIRRYLDPIATRQTKAAYCAAGLLMFVCLLYNMTEATLFSRSSGLFNCYPRSCDLWPVALAQIWPYKLDVHQLADIRFIVLYG